VNQNREQTTRRGRCRGDRAAALTEGAIVAPVFFLLLFAIIEFGITFRNKLTFEAAAQRGVRMAAIQGNSPGADQAVLKDVVHFLEISNTVEDLKIVVYNADAAAAEPTDACKAGTPVKGECNVYEPGDELATSNFGGILVLSHLDGYFRPTDRSIESGDQQCIGIYITGYQPFFTGFFGNGMSFTTNAVARIEPQKFTPLEAALEPCGAKSVSSK
jgi:hypothetical protein